VKAPRWRISLAVRLTAAVGILLTLVVAFIFGLDRAFPDHHVAIAAGVLVVALLLLFVIVRTTLRPLLSMFHASTLRTTFKLMTLSCRLKICF